MHEDRFVIFGRLRARLSYVFMKFMDSPVTRVLCNGSFEDFAVSFFPMEVLRFVD